MLTINPKYIALKPWLETLPDHFDTDGEVIYQARNTIRRITVNNLNLVVKRYHKPALPNRIIYSTLRQPKALRAYENAITLNELSIPTPEPVALLIPDKLILESYLVTIESPLKHTFFDFRDGVTDGREDIIRAFARFAADMHQKGILHRDFSPGNILYDCIDGKPQFQVVDINRMSFRHLTWQDGCRNFARLWGKRRFFEILADEYAMARNLNPTEVLAEILKARETFWRHRPTDHFVTDESFTTAVIVSTYNNPAWLEKCFWGLMNQQHPADEIIIADDGSDDRTAQLIKTYCDRLPLKHIWHEDKGFRKTTILNKAVLAATSDYLIFLDQDLIPRRDFIRQHYIHARRNHFISGGAVKLTQSTSDKISFEDITSQRCFSIKWLTANGTPNNWKLTKLWRSKLLCRLMNFITPTKATWNGGNSSTWREYILNAKGFDQRMRYGAEDREFGSRLENAGIHGIQLRYGIPVLHLWHTRPYVNNDNWQRNKAIWHETITQHKTTTDYGIN